MRHFALVLCLLTAAAATPAFAGDQPKPEGPPSARFDASAAPANPDAAAAEEPKPPAPKPEDKTEEQAAS